MRNVRWFFIPANRLAEYLGGRRAERGVRYTTGLARGKTYKPNGKRECARRVRQMDERRAFENWSVAQ